MEPNEPRVVTCEPPLCECLGLPEFVSYSLAPAAPCLMLTPGTPWTISDGDGVVLMSGTIGDGVLEAIYASRPFVSARVGENGKG